jgi:hypothetical protein
MVMLDIAKDGLDGLANECDPAPHEFHRNSSRHALWSVMGVLCAPDDLDHCRNLAWLLICE